TAHTPVQSTSELRAEHGFRAEDVARITVRAGPKVLAQHANREPRDVMEAQYSVPFCTAVALYDDPLDPHAFSQRSLDNPAIRAMARRVCLEALPEGAKLSSWGSEVVLQLVDARELRRMTDTFKGMPEMPLTTQELHAKYARCAAGFGDAERLFTQLLALEQVDDVRELAVC
ncbi:MAG: hypothetical protein ACM3SO_16080, partial [Betaproteobacteria bacterium]